MVLCSWNPDFFKKYEPFAVGRKSGDTIPFLEIVVSQESGDIIPFFEIVVSPEFHEKKSSGRAGGLAVPPPAALPAAPGLT